MRNYILVLAIAASVLLSAGIALAKADGCSVKGGGCCCDCCQKK